MKETRNSLDGVFESLFSLVSIWGVCVRVCVCVLPPAGATAAVCGAAGDSGPAGGAAIGRPRSLLLPTGAGEGQSTAAPETHGHGRGRDLKVFAWVCFIHYGLCLCVCDGSSTG